MLLVLICVFFLCIFIFYYDSLYDFILGPHALLTEGSPYIGKIFQHLKTTHVYVKITLNSLKFIIAEYNLESPILNALIKIINVCNFKVFRVNSSLTSGESTNT